MKTDLYQIDNHKLMQHPQRVAQWLDAGTDWDQIRKIYPLYVEISPVGQCNHRCTFCSVDYIGYQRRSIHPERLEMALGEMGRMGVKSVMFAGEGEPLLHVEIAGMIRTAKEAGIDVAITTNATPLTAELSEQCLGNVTWLKASVNAGNTETYAAVHRTKAADFDRVLNNLSAAVRLRKLHGWSTTLGAQIVLIPENRHTVCELASTCQGIGLDYLVVKPYSQNPNSTGTAERHYDEFDYRACEDLAAELAEYNTDSFKVVYRHNTIANLADPERAYQTCHATPNFWAYIMATGDVYGCSAHLLDPRFCFGNINEQSFSEIWEWEKRRECVELMRTFDLTKCRKNCRMEHANVYLDRLKNPHPHDAFI